MDDFAVLFMILKETEIVDHIMGGETSILKKFDLELIWRLVHNQESWIIVKIKIFWNLK